MPAGTHIVKKRGPGKYSVVKKLPGGRSKTVAHSTNPKDARITAGIRDRGSKGERGKR